MTATRNEIMLSVCVMTYNHELYIKQTLEGILLQQTSFILEIVIGEDCSTDNTRQICLEYKEKYPNIIKLNLPDKNLGAAENFRLTHQLCKGKYIAFCDGDDYWTDPNKLQVQFEFLEANPDYGLVHTNYEYYREAIGTIAYIAQEIHTGSIFKDLLQNNEIATLTVVARNEYLKLGVEEGVLAECGFLDYAFWLYISERSKIHYLNKYTAVYRSLPESISNTNSPIKKKRFERLILDIKKYFAERNNCLAELKDQIVQFNKDDLSFAFHFNKPEIANSAYLYLSENNKLSIRDKLLYYGGKFSLIRAIIKPMLEAKNRK